MPCARAIAPISASGCTVPTSLLAYITLIKIVSGRIARLDRVRIDHAVVIDLDARHLEAVQIAQLLDGRANGVMLDREGDDVIAAFRLARRQGRAANRQVIALGAAAREHDLGRLTIQDAGNGPAGVFQGGSRTPAKPVDARRVPVDFGPVRSHRFDNAGSTGVVAEWSR